MNTAILIPIYKSKVNLFEDLSLNQVLKILDEYSIIFVCPNNLDTSYYHNKIKNGTFERFDDSFFIGLEGYNKLMLSLDFYKRFINFQYILILQLDVFVFRNAIEYWSNQGFVYIGSPMPKIIIEGIKHKYFLDFNLTIPEPFEPLFNGGFSLRHVNSFIEIINENNETIDQLIEKKWFEDTVFSILFLQKKTKYKLPNTKIALKFAFETYPEKSYISTNFELPMGAHAWYRNSSSDMYNILFWFKHVSIALDKKVWYKIYLYLNYYILFVKTILKKRIKKLTTIINRI